MLKIFIGGVFILVISTLILSVFLIDSSKKAKRDRHLVSVTRTVVQTKITPEVTSYGDDDGGYASPVYSIDGKLYQSDVDLKPKDSVSILWYRYDGDTAKVYELVKN